jgi:hypothetical protein
MIFNVSPSASKRHSIKRSAAAHSRTGPPRTSSLAKVQVLERHGRSGERESNLRLRLGEPPP